MTLSRRSVRRTDLNSNSQSPEPCCPDPILEVHVQQHLARIFNEYPESSNIGDVNEAGSHNQETIDDADEYEFRLFAKPTISSGASRGNRIVLRSPTPPSGAPGFVKPRRPDTCYFTGQPSEKLREQFRLATISGEQLARGLDIRWVWLCY